MDLFLIITAGILLLLGFAGSILPLLPGIPLSYVGILLLHFTQKVSFSTEFLVFWAVVVILVQLLDTFIPIWGTKKFGGTRFGIIGCTIGLLVGLFFGPVGIILGPFVGAIVGELIAGQQSHKAFRAAFGSFVGLLAGTVAKLVVAGFLIYHYVLALMK